ncbi:short-chain dehydrogenase/reductase family 9C member 7-like isoform X1 [Dermacentor variabilis]|uniref:short-chain dehydrogenase/reductase family 9C member 7-like isoform X1 n=1 Tax=Dermacentor variabilis TaxID=34621 RepID=UPI003F5C45A0
MLGLVYPSVCASLALVSWLIAPGLWTLAQTAGALWLLSVVGRRITEELYALIGGKHVDPKGKAVLITGCDSGFGLELAVRLHSRGMRVFAACLLPDSLGANKLRALSSFPSEEGRGSVHVIAPMDVTSDSQVEDAVQQVTKILASEGRTDKEDDQGAGRHDGDDGVGVAEAPQLWALVANAGVIWASELEWGSLEPMRRMLEVNAVGVARTVRAFLPMVRRTKGGRVVITTSLWGYFAIPFSVAYSMSKCAARFFADGLRREMKKFGVRVVSIEPNMYATNLTADGILLPAMDKLWQETSEEVRRDYGQGYYELSRQYLRRALVKSRTEIHEVVDAMEAAVLARRPRFAYRPDGPLRALQFGMLEMAPPIVQDAFLIRDTQPPASTLPGNRGIARG